MHSKGDIHIQMNVDISFTMHDLNLKLRMCIKDRQGVSGRCAALGTSIHNYGGYDSILCIL